MTITFWMFLRKTAGMGIKKKPQQMIGMRESELTMIPFPDIVIQSLKIRLFYLPCGLSKSMGFRPNSYICSITRAKYPGLMKLNLIVRRLGNNALFPSVQQDFVSQL